MTVRATRQDQIMQRRQSVRQREDPGIEIISHKMEEDGYFRLTMRDRFEKWPYQLLMQWPKDVRFLKKGALRLVTPHVDNYLRMTLGLWYSKELPEGVAVESRLEGNDYAVEFLLGDYDKTTKEFCVRMADDVTNVLIRAEGWLRTDVDVDSGVDFLGYPIFDPLVLFVPAGWIAYAILSLEEPNWPAVVPLASGEYCADDEMRIAMVTAEVRSALRDYVRRWS